ncbi:MAG TPA: TraR/DksA family transcriptional regulator [Thermodesulfobacteriota bacterium]|nr:TraR/DksA family transcriptional regulator [Thermodesulfobacteriota bacterium]
MATKAKDATKDAMSEMREILLNMRKALLGEIRDNVKEESDYLKAPATGDIYDLASSERERELSLLLGDRDREKLAEIDEALRRIEEGSYGYCEECGEKIGIGRLKAMPFTQLCVECKSRLEKEIGARKRFDEESTYRDLALGDDEDE